MIIAVTVIIWLLGAVVAEETGDEPDIGIYINTCDLASHYTLSWDALGDEDTVVSPPRVGEGMEGVTQCPDGVEAHMASGSLRRNQPRTIDIVKGDELDSERAHMTVSRSPPCLVAQEWSS